MLRRPVEFTQLLFNDRDGTGRLVEALQGGLNLTNVLPSFIQPDWASQLPWVVAWVGVGLLAGIVAFALGRRRGSVDRAYWSGAVGLVGFMMAGSLVSGETVITRQVRNVLHTGQQSLVEAFDGTRLIAYSYRERSVLSDADLFRHAKMMVPLGERLPPDFAVPPLERGRVAGPYALPAGRYVVRVWLDEMARRKFGATDAVWVAYHRGPGVLGRRSVADLNPVEIVLDLPVTFDRVWVGATSEPTAGAISQIQIEPVVVAPQTGRPTISNIRHVEMIDDVPGRYVIRVDDNIFSELDGFWVRGGRSASLYVAPGDASALRITVRNGATPGPVVLDIGGRHETIELGSHQRREITVPLTGKGLEGPVTIEAVNGFRPSEHNPETRDIRWLGCWVTLELLS